MRDLAGQLWRAHWRLAERVQEVFVFCSLSRERVLLGLLFIADSMSTGFPRKETR